MHAANNSRTPLSEGREVGKARAGGKQKETTKAGRKGGHHLERCRWCFWGPGERETTRRTEIIEKLAGPGKRV